MSSNNSHLSIQSVLEEFSNSSLRKKRSLVNEVEKRVDEIVELDLMKLDIFDPNKDNWAAGWIFQVLNRHRRDKLEQFLGSKLNKFFNAPSSRSIDYSELEKYLLEEKYEDADRFTSACLRKLAGKSAESRGYVYFSEVENIPEEDLSSMDKLWIIFSQGKFGFSIQSRILKSVGGRYELMWPKIGWKIEGVWTRYPTSFDWSINAPDGHMPLVNQLRGIRLMDSLLKHPGVRSRT